MKVMENLHKCAQAQDLPPGNLRSNISAVSLDFSITADPLPIERFYVWEQSNIVTPPPEKKPAKKEAAK
jgi:hypothetical protein